MRQRTPALFPAPRCPFASDPSRKALTSFSLQLFGPVRQELLSGISDEQTFLNLKYKLEPFDDLPLTTYDHEMAARYFNICRSHGEQGSHTDFLICAVAVNNDLLIFTTDQDFYRFAKFLPIRLFEPEIQ